MEKKQRKLLCKLLIFSDVHVDPYSWQNRWYFEQTSGKQAVLFCNAKNINTQEEIQVAMKQGQEFEDFQLLL